MTMQASRPVVDGTRKECKGVIAGLENACSVLLPGTAVLALVADVPSRIDVRAWAERKGHVVSSDERKGDHFEMVIINQGSRSSRSS